MESGTKTADCIYTTNDTDYGICVIRNILSPTSLDIFRGALFSSDLNAVFRIKPTRWYYSENSSLFRLSISFILTTIATKMSF